MAKEQNFVSAVVYLQNCEERVVPFLQMLQRQFSQHFEHFEIVCVNDACTDGTTAAVKTFCDEQGAFPLTLVNMSTRQGLEMAMNAGLDMAIGDFVFEFDSTEILYDEELVWQAYGTALRGGYDIVCATPGKSRSFFSGLFYRVFNWASPSIYDLQTDVFHLLSRRAINRVHAVNSTLYYRKAAYASSGLKVCNMPFTPKASLAGSKENAKVSHAVDNLLLYTAAGYKISFGFALAMLGATVFEILYTLYFYFVLQQTVAGWATTMLVLSFGLFGVFTLLAIVIKYLSLLLELTFKNQKYLIESIERIQK